MCYGSGNQAPDAREDVALMKEAFDFLDKDGDGNIVASDLSAFLKTYVDSNVSAEEINRMISVADRDGDGSVQFEEFSSLLQCQLVGRGKTESFSNMGNKALKDMFNMLDRNGDGVICLDDLKNVMGTLGHSLTPDDLHAMVETASGSGHPHVSYQDFLHLMNSTWRL